VEFGETAGGSWLGQLAGDLQQSLDRRELSFVIEGAQLRSTNLVQFGSNPAPVLNPVPVCHSCRLERVRRIHHRPDDDSFWQRCDSTSTSGWPWHTTAADVSRYFVFFGPMLRMKTRICHISLSERVFLYGSMSALLSMPSRMTQKISPSVDP